MSDYILIINPSLYKFNKDGYSAIGLRSIGAENYRIEILSEDLKPLAKPQHHNVNKNIIGLPTEENIAADVIRGLKQCIGY